MRGWTGAAVRSGGLLLCLLLAACAAPRPAPEPADADSAYAARAEELGRWQGWSLTGRLGVTQAEDGGSGRLDWTQRQDGLAMRFRGALGQGAWRLTSDPGSARLERADGAVREAADLDALVYAETGWAMPVRALAWWVRGLAWPGGGAPARLELNADGTPKSLEQQGWRVDYERYTAGPDERLLPSRLEARRGDVTIRLAVSRWGRLGARDEADG